MAVLYSDDLQIDHYAPILSRQAFITFVFLFMTLFIPFVLIVPTHCKFVDDCNGCLEFLIYDTVTYEQADVRNLNEIIVALYTPTQSYFFGSNNEINTLHGSQTTQTAQFEVTFAPVDLTFFV